MKHPSKTLSGFGLQNAEAPRQLRHREKIQIEKLSAEDREKEEKRELSDEQKKHSEWGNGIEQTASARHCQSQIRTGDPMAEYMAKKKQKEIITRMPEYSGPPPLPNRFGLKPGYRWDGVDRSNGFENKYIEKINSLKAGQEKAYLWSVQEM